MSSKQQFWLRGVILLAALASAISLVWSWRAQTSSRLTCISLFEPRREHNGYFQINILSPHATEEMFEGELFAYYPAYQNPAKSVRIVRLASGTYAPSIIDTQMTAFNEGLATPGALKVGLPTPGNSQRRFPFDSPRFDLRFTLKPPIRPGGVIVRNLSPDFVLPCSSLEAQWDGRDQLRIKVSARRNPFVQTTAVLMVIAAVIFAASLALIRQTEDLAVATASYFFSIWSIRGIVSPSGLSYSSLFDLWLLGASLLVLFVVGWRLTVSRGAV